MRAYTEDAVMDWQNQLNTGSQLWNIQLTSTATSDTCNISIQFIAKPTLDEQGGIPDVIGVTHFYTDHTAQIKIFYNSLAVDENGSYYFLDSLAPDYQIQWTIKHELGHAFGLNHYMMSDDEQKSWLTGLTPTPSIMVTIVPPSFVVAGTVMTYSPTITSRDITQLQSLYPNGFGGQNYPSAPSTPSVPTPEMTSSDINYWEPLIREYFINNTNRHTSNYYGVHVLVLVDIFDSKQLVSIPDPVDKLTDRSFFMFMPSWFENDLSYWATSQMSDNDLASAMQYLYNNGLFYFSQK
ncbi:MAG TPA: hypothetical protein VFU58_06000 [Candidatus Nitrosotalea sp.]|nr:hypothetical protein [Candidatus Nitrosotalea sp.]